MTTLILAVALLANPSEWEHALRLLAAPKPAEQSVIAEPEIQPAPVVVEQKPVQQYRTETRYRMVRKKFCHGGRCYYRMVREPYQVRVPVASAATKSWPRYPTTPRQQPWTQGGRHITWRHLTQGEHAGKFNAAWLQTLSQLEVEQLHADDHENKVQWSHVVRP